MSPDEIRNETGIYFPMYKSLWDLAKGKDTDEKRLAFYDTILDAAFDPENFEPPERPVKGKSKPIDYARWDAWNSVMHILDRYFKAKKKRELGRLYGKRGGRPRRVDMMPSTASDDGDEIYGREGDEITRLMSSEEGTETSPQKREETFEELNNVENGVGAASMPLGSSPHKFDTFEEFCAFMKKHDIQFYTNMNSCRRFCKDDVRIMREVFDRLQGSDWKDKNNRPINNMCKVVFWTLKYVAADLKSEYEQRQNENNAQLQGKSKAEIQDDLEERRRKRLKAAGASW